MKQNITKKISESFLLTSNKNILKVKASNSNKKIKNAITTI